MSEVPQDRGNGRGMQTDKVRPSGGLSAVQKPAATKAECSATRDSAAVTVGERAKRTSRPTWKVRPEERALSCELAALPERTLTGSGTY